MSTHYEILKVSNDASVDEITKAYRALAKKIHPDVGGTEAIFRLVQEAYETLRDSDKRSAYDASLRGDSRNTVRYTITPSSFSLHTLEWNEVRECSFRLTWEGDLSGTDLEIDWVGTRPDWASELNGEPTDHSIEFSFTIDASKVGPGRYLGQIEFKAIKGGKITANNKIPVAFFVKRLDIDSMLELEGMDRIRCGPLEVGQTQAIRATILNSGEPIWNTPSFVWAGSAPSWAGPIKVDSIPGRVFPVNISFSVDSKSCTPETHTAKIEAKVDNQVVGVFPVILQVLKIPVPVIKVFAGGDKPINFGAMQWDESKFFDIRIENAGDELKQPIHCSTTTPWIELAELQPNDLNSFPKVLRVVAHAKRVSTEGDYVGEIRIEHEEKTCNIKAVIRVEPRPSLQATAPTISFKHGKGEVTGSVSITKPGNDIPKVIVRWEKFDQHAQKPTINKGWPLKINFKLRLSSLRDSSHLPGSYQNALLVEILDDEDKPISNIRIPITI